MNKTSIQKTDIYDITKVITTLLVVIAHATRMYTPRGLIHPVCSSPFLNTFTNYIYTFHMPLFMFLSGSIYSFCLEKGKYSDSAAFIRSKAKRLLIPYFAFGFLYVAPVMCLLNLSSDNYLTYCLNGILLSQNSRHLWYLLALFWIFLFAVLIKPIYQKGKGYEILLILISCVLYTVKEYIPDLFQFKDTFQFQLFFVLGMIFNCHYSMFERIFQKFGFFFWLCPFILMLRFVFGHTGKIVNIYKVLGICMMLYFSWTILRYKPRINNLKLYKSLKRNSFGIYLFHPMIIYALFAFLGQYSINPLLLSIVAFIASTVISYAATEFLRKKNLHILIGE